MSPPDLWKWKWSNGVGKSEMSIIWCISITNNVKSNKKINETAQTANFTDFPLILSGNGPKGTKTLFSEVFMVCHRKTDVQGFPKMWLLLLLKFVKPELWLVKVWSNLKTKNKVCLICVQDVCIIDLVLTHLNQPWGPPWTLETLGDPWRPLATMPENGHFGHFRSYLSHFPTWYSKSGHFPIEIPIKNEKWPPTPSYGSIILKIVLWAHFTITHAVLRGSTNFWETPYSGKDYWSISVSFPSLLVRCDIWRYTHMQISKWCACIFIYLYLELWAGRQQCTLTYCLFY